MLAGANGARIAMIETNGWDTHSAQRGRLAAQLSGLDQMVVRDESRARRRLGEHFGARRHRVRPHRAPNGTGGTDHGQASAAMLLGGAVAGGKVIADWPGLSPSALYEGRDLKPTTDLDALIGGALAQHYAVGARRG